MGQVYSLTSTNENNTDTDVNHNIDVENNSVEVPDIIESNDETKESNDETIKKEVKLFVNKIIDDAVSKYIDSINQQRNMDVNYNQGIYELKKRISISSLSSNDESLISSLSDTESISDIDSGDGLDLDINNIEDIEIQVKMELLNSNKKIIQLKTENERLREEYDDLFFNFTRLKVKYESLVFKHKKD